MADRTASPPADDPRQATGGLPAADAEVVRTRPRYLIADDPGDLVGPIPKVAPPVIGEPHDDWQLSEEGEGGSAQ